MLDMQVTDEEIKRVYDVVVSLVTDEEKQNLPSAPVLVRYLKRNLIYSACARKDIKEGLKRIVHYLPKTKLKLTNEDIQYIIDSYIDLSEYDTATPNFIDAASMASLLRTRHLGNKGQMYPENYYRLLARYIIEVSMYKEEPTAEQINEAISRRDRGRYDYVMNITHEDVREIGGPSL